MAVVEVRYAGGGPAQRVNAAAVGAAGGGVAQRENSAWEPDVWSRRSTRRRGRAGAASEMRFERVMVALVWLIGKVLTDAVGWCSYAEDSSRTGDDTHSVSITGGE
uniref:hypothetical protein n=1 Tax=Streptomyces sp. NBC_00008 TaxID=2903610 RepID=UPI002F909D4A